MVNIGIIGAGRIVEWFLKDLTNSKYKKNIKILAIWNRTNSKAKKLAKSFNIENVYNDVDTLLKQDLDLIYIGTADEYHYNFVCKSIIAKKNVWVEKPIALTFKDASHLYELAKENDVLLFEGIKTGLSQSVIEAKKIIESKILGEPVYMYATHAKVSTSGNISNPSSDSIVAGFHMAGGMYALFTALHLFGSAKTINSSNNKYKNNSAIQTSVLTIRHQNGCISTVVGSDSFTDDLSTKIMFEKGYIKLGGRIDLYNEPYKKDSAHLPYTISVFDNQNNLQSFNNFKFETEGEGICLVLDHVYELLINNKKESNIVTQKISKEIIYILEYTNNLEEKTIFMED